jgi:GMP synthase-like glutamine amidotransferase
MRRRINIIPILTNYRLTDIDVYYNHTAIKLYGSCFGHQVLCKALFEKTGAIVQRDPTGWELGVHSVSLSDQFAADFSHILSSKSLRLQFLHGDRVLLPDGSIPDDIISVGTTPHCQIQGIYQPGRILTYQGHPEFDEYIETVCLELVGKRVGWEAQFTENAISSARAPDDAAVAADTIIGFFLGAATA